MGEGFPEHSAFWFRTVGKATDYLTVYANGSINYEGLDAYYKNNRAIWPAMWITID